jgi:hypothetical protein
VSEVLTVLRRRLHEAGLEPDEVGIRPIAEAISTGTFAHYWRLARTLTKFSRSAEMLQMTWSLAFIRLENPSAVLERCRCSVRVGCAAPVSRLRLPR